MPHISNPLTVVAACISVSLFVPLSGPAAGAAAHNTFRVERILRYPIAGAATCAEAWTPALWNQLAQGPVPEGVQFPPLITSIPQRDGILCVATLFSRHFQDFCAAGTICGNRAGIPVECAQQGGPRAGNAAKPDRPSRALHGTRG